jgi:hypothetical protein
MSPLAIALFTVPLVGVACFGWSILVIGLRMRRVRRDTDIQGRAFGRTVRGIYQSRDGYGITGSRS